MTHSCMKDWTSRSLISQTMEEKQLSSDYNSLVKTISTVSLEKNPHRIENGINKFWWHEGWGNVSQT